MSARAADPIPFATPALSVETITLNGVPVWNEVIPENSHPPSILFVSPGFLKKGKSHT
jgi:hypothetical protein